MIGNEMNRATGFVDPSSSPSLRACYERVLRLTDLTVEVNPVWTLRRELLRWRDLIAAAYLDAAAGAGLDADAHRAASRALLQLRPVAARQIAFLMG